MWHIPRIRIVNMIIGLIDNSGTYIIRTEYIRQSGELSGCNIDERKQTDLVIVGYYIVDHRTLAYRCAVKTRNKWNSIIMRKRRDI